jgi:hypothetical protein
MVSILLGRFTARNITFLLLTEDIQVNIYGWRLGVQRRVAASRRIALSRTCRLVQ